MITLYLDDKQAVVDEKQTVKFVRENTYFTKSGSYTYDVALPALCPENIAIFGHLYRKDQRKAVKVTYSARLNVDNVDILNGTATITSITGTTIKVQLMGGNSELNFYNKYEERFIDELPLGNWRRGEYDKTMRLLAEDIKGRFEYYLYSGAKEAYKQICTELWKENRKGDMVDWVALPCYNTNYDIVCNNFGCKTYESKKEGDDRRDAENCVMINDLNTVNLSAQPYLVPMIERIFENIGYPVKENCLQDNEFFMHMVIVTANNRSDIARALPHWTLSEFISQIEKFFAVVITVDEKQKKTYIRNRTNFFKSNVEFIDNVLDEYSVNIENDNTTELNNANIGYADVASPYNRIESPIKDIAKIDTTYDNESNITDALNLLVQNLRQEVENGNISAYKGTIFKVCGHSYIIQLYDHVDVWGNVHPNHAYIICVDEFADRINNISKKDIDVELKICPAETINNGNVPFYGTDGSIIANAECFMLAKADNTNPTGIQDEIEHNLNDLISGEVERVDYKEDIMFICLYDGGFAKFIEDPNKYDSSQLAYIRARAKRYPSGYVKDEWIATTYVGGDRDGTDNLFPRLANESLSLNSDSVYRTIESKVFEYKTLYSEVFKNLNHVNKQVKYCFKFITDRIDLPVNSTFIIRNKKFVCEKLEYNIKTDKVCELVTGYFYELEE